MTRVSDFLVWGNNQSNLLSKSSSKCLSTPVPLSLPYEIVSICASEKHISFITKEGQLFSFGSNLDGRLGVSTRSVDKVAFDEPIQIELGSKIVRAESGFSHMCVLTEKLELLSWGLGDYGALGTGQFKSRSTPSRVDIPKQMVSKLRQISCGAMHTAFLFEDGTFYTCGSNQYGELGVNKPQKVSTPLPITFHLPVQQISCGVFYTLLLTRDGRVYGMGNNKYGQLGTGHKVNECHPTLIRQLTDIVKVTAGYHSGAIDKFGSLYIWGSGSFGELLRPKKFVLSVPIQDIAIRGFFGVAIGHTSKNQNRIYSWGNNTFGQLGVGNYEASKEPQEIQTLRGLDVNKIALGVNFALVLLHPPAIHSRLIQDQYEQREKSKKRYRKEMDKSSNPPISDRKSVIGFQQKYLNSDLRSDDYLNLNSKRREGSLFERIKTQRPKESQKSQYIEREKSDVRSKYKSDDLREDQRSSLSKSPKIELYPPSRYESRYDARYDPLYDNRYDRQEQRSGRHKDVYVEPYSNAGPAKDYQKLFIQLSADYQALVKKYVRLERQIQSKPQQQGLIKLSQEKERLLAEENVALKNQVSQLKYELVLFNDEQRVLKRKNQQLLIDNQKLLYEQGRGSTITLSPTPPPQNAPLTAQIEQQYNKLLTQKEQTITKLNMSLEKSQEQFKTTMNKILEQNSNLKDQLNMQIQNNRKIIKDHQSLIDQLQIEIKKSEEINLLLKEDNQSLKNQFLALKNRIGEVEKLQVKVSEMAENEKVIKQKYEANLKESVIKGEEMNNRLAQLEVELSYQKQFNQKYQETIQQIKEQSQKLHKELNLQSNLNLERNGKIENLKSEVERYKKYKKELDEKNIQVQEFNNTFEGFKRKSKQIIQEKEKQIKSQQQFMDRKTKQFESALDKKEMEMQDIARENSRLQKEITKNKENISVLKNEIVLKNDQLLHLNQQKSNTEKKLAILSTEIKKQIDEREAIVKEHGQSKRQVTRLKILINETEAKLKFQTQEKEKIAKNLAFKEEQLNHLKSEYEKLNEKCENLKKENTQQRQQIEEVSYELETQTKLNQELTKANREFAEDEEEYTQKINQLESKIYELEDENKSYTPRYEALLMRNRELDDRNRELGEMINKAIQIQAESYKNNILKEVQINTDNIINQFKQEQEFQARGRRNKGKAKQVSHQIPDEGSLTKRGEKTSTVVKDEPYTKMMKERITQHKRKVSQSAQKLANLLDLNERSGRESKQFPQRNPTQDYEKINSQMQSFNNQKEEFMSKIHSFAEKLKII